MKNYALHAAVIGLVLAAAQPFALAQTKGKSPSGPAVVNGAVIAKALVDQTVNANVAQGQPDSPELRQFILEELINRELLAQDAVAKKLDRSDQGQLRLQQARQAVLIDMAVSDYFAKNPIKDSELKAEYARQIEMLGGVGPLTQYQLRLAVLGSETQAREMIQKVRSGASFETLAREQSTDPSKQNGGLLDWLLPTQILPTISTVIVNLGKGAVAAAPIQTPGGWAVVKVEDTRAFTPPKYEDSLEQLRASLIQQRRIGYVNELRKAAKITRD